MVYSDGDVKRLLGMKGISLDWQTQSIMLVVQDFTDVYCSEIQKEQDSLRSKYRTLFIRAFNHEVRHPIHTLQLLTDHIAEAKNISDIREDVVLIQNECQTLVHLTQTLNDHQEMESKQFKLELNLIEPDNVCRGAI